MREKERNCKAVCELLTAYLDGEVTSQDKAYIEAHFPNCPQCRAELEALAATQTSLRNAFKSMADEASPSAQVWDKIKARLEVKDSRLNGLCRLFIKGKVWQVATVTAAIFIVTAAVIWQHGGFGGLAAQKPATQYGQFKGVEMPPSASENMPRWTDIQTPAPAPVPPPQPAFVPSSPMPAPQPTATVEITTVKTTRLTGGEAGCSISETVEIVPASTQGISGPPVVYKWEEAIRNSPSYHAKPCMEQWESIEYDYYKR